MSRTGNGLLRGGGERLAFFDVINGGHFNRHSARVVRIVDRSGWDHEAISRLYFERRLTIDQDFALSFDDITYLFTRMSMASGGRPWRTEPGSTCGPAGSPAPTRCLAG